ncbi:MAG: hypothetical protein MI923_27460 [Phycisphaerales bacterium]|nr:hypothetical protein [Phycisphaerales bacterium]
MPGRRCPIVCVRAKGGEFHGTSKDGTALRETVIKGRDSPTLLGGKDGESAILLWHITVHADQIERVR